jgi:hypothetical protein
MYLFIWLDKRIRVVRDNLTIADHLAVKNNLLTIVRYDKEKNSYVRLVHDNDRAYWVPVLEGEDAITADAKIHF